MNDTTISLRIDKNLYEKMRMAVYINWSALLRNKIAQELEKIEVIDLEKAKKASKIMDELRKKKAFTKGKESTAIIREWRNKRK